MFRQGQLAVHGLAILFGRNEAGILNRGEMFLHHAVLYGGCCHLVHIYSQCSPPPGGAGAGPRDVVAGAAVLALAPLAAVLPVRAVRALDVALKA